MISIHCTHCKQLLEMDDAFAGGVCRCQHCGTIQTVPSHLKDKRAGSTGSKTSSSKALYQKRAARDGSGTPVEEAPATPGTGLDELAQIVASSGLSRGSLTTKPPRTGGGGGGSGGGPRGRAAAAEQPPAPAPREAKSKLPLLIGGGVLALVIVGAVILLAIRPGAPVNATAGKGTPRPSGAAANAKAGVDPTATPPAAQAGPAFAGVPLPKGAVVYLIDRSQANDEILDTVKAAAYKSVRSLGEGREFQIIFWHRRDEGIVAYPAEGLAPATRSQVEQAAKRFEDVVAYGTTELKPTIEAAMKSNPAALVIATAKGFNLDEDTAATAKAAIKGAPVKVHTFSLGEAESAALRAIAEDTGGTYHEMSDKQLRALSR